MTRIEALDIAISLFEDYLSGSPDAEKDFQKAQEKLIGMRNQLEKEKLERKNIYE